VNKKNLMAPTDLEKDTDLVFPHFTLLKASAGSGKTYALSQRFVQYLLSKQIPKNRLRNMVAMTFSNNAAREMRERIILWLKKLAIGDPETLARFSALISLPGEELRVSACRTLEEILDQYADFQVRTIDSFMTTIFKASALDFGYNPDFDILLDNTLMMEYAFHRYLRRVSDGTADAAMLESMISRISVQKKGEASYLWDPCDNLIDEIRQLSKAIAAKGQKLAARDSTKELRSCEAGIKKSLDVIGAAIADSGLLLSRSSSYMKSDIPGLVREGRFYDLVGKKLALPPVSKPKTKEPDDVRAYEKITGLWEDFAAIVRSYTVLYAYSFYLPYLSVYVAFEHTIDDIKRAQGAIFIEDISRCLASYLDLYIIPDIYFRLGETINHFFVDEFQDTSPIQWKNLFPLLENALSERGSVFAVGDTKQSIYGFRDADYRIMKNAGASNPFPSAAHDVRELETNFRSCPEILSFNEHVFKNIIAGHEEAGGAARESGLADYIQNPDPDSRVHGHVELHLVGRSDDGNTEKEKLREIVNVLRNREYNYSDIAVLTPRNDDAVRITAWLNERNIPFISFSSLDIRKRKVTGEIVSLLKFLALPTDDLSFATFLLGDIFNGLLAVDVPATDRPDFGLFLFEARQCRPLYRMFQEKFPAFWERYFSGLFRSSGYLPLYDLVTQVYHVFCLFEYYPEEEATLIKLLETVKDFEGQGFNSLGDFLRFASNEDAAEAEWHMNVPTTRDAIKVMTIHKAKGLGFRVAIIMLFEHRPPGSAYVVKDNGEEFSILKITKDMAELDSGLQELYDAADRKELVNSLNSLYVGFSRPEEELHIIGVAEKPEQPSYPLSLLPFRDYRGIRATDRQAEKKETPLNDMQLMHHHGEMVFPVLSAAAPGFREKQRGDLIHELLALICYFDERPDEAVDLAIGQLVSQCAADLQLDEVRRTVISFLRRSEICAYFLELPERMVWNEKEIADETGRLYRLDRIVADSDRITVIDYKTGSEQEAEESHIPQMRNYMKILRSVYPDHLVTGIIAYIDFGKQERVS
jgi:ATP-dependent helicase/nuclease subunit A